MLNDIQVVWWGIKDFFATIKVRLWDALGL